MTKKAKLLAREALLKEYFELISKEKMPKTPEITKKLDDLESSIRELDKKSR